MTCRVHTIASVEDAAALEEEWSALASHTRGATPFQWPAWLLPWYSVWAADRVHLIALRRDDGRLAAVLPAVRVDGRLELAGSGVGDYLAPIVDASAVRDLGPMLDGALAGQACLFHDVPDEISWPRAEENGPWCVAPASTCPRIPLPDSIDVWRASLPSGLRRNLRRYGNRLEAAGAHCRTVSGHDEIAPALDALFALHARRWQDRNQPGIFAERDVQRFHRASAPKLFDRGLLRLHLLATETAIVGVQYVLVHGTTAYSYIAGFDPEWNEVSPGTLLMAYAIERAIDEGCSVFDLLRGAEAYKYGWGAVDRWTRRCEKQE